MRKEKEVKCVMQRLYCDQCGTEMQHDGYVAEFHSPQISYKCPQCGYKTTMSESYPRIDYVEVEEEQGINCMGCAYLYGRNDELVCSHFNIVNPFVTERCKEVFKERRHP